MQPRKLHFYAMDICSGFWEWLDKANSAGILCSIDKVREELMKGTDSLVKWAKNYRDGFFMPIDKDEKVAKEIAFITNWIYEQDYTEDARREFLEKTDFYLIAYAKAHNLTLVTFEKANGGRHRVTIPDVCNNLGVPCMSLFQLLRQEGIRFIWTPPS